MEVAQSELLGALSLATDAAVGVPPETALRTCLLATRIGRAAGLSEAQLGDVYHAALLRHLGCTSFAHEEARANAGDDQGLLAAFEDVDLGRPLRVAARAVSRVGRGAGPARRAGALARFLADPGAARRLARAHCAQAMTLGRQLGIGEGAVAALGEIYERFDGRGLPHGIRGEAISTAARVLHVANVAEVELRHGGAQGAVEVVKRRAKGQLDPAFARVFVAHHADVIDGLDGSVWDSFVAAEPRPRRFIQEVDLDRVAFAFAQYVDLKSPFTLGHSVGVAELAVQAASSAGLPPDRAERLRRAALLHDLGRVSVPNGIWDKPGRLTAAEWERVRLHAYYTERILAFATPLRDVAAIAGAHHERGDGSGYHRGTRPPPSEIEVHILAAADTYRAMREHRAHRRAHSAVDAARELERCAASGLLDRSAVGAVLAAAGHRVSPGAVWPDELTDREVGVLTLVARGLTNKEIAAALGISAKTVQHHVAHVYRKTGVDSRAAAALYATTHRLV